MEKYRSISSATDTVPSLSPAGGEIIHPQFSELRHDNAVISDVLMMRHRAARSQGLTPPHPPPRTSAISPPFHGPPPPPFPTTTGLCPSSRPAPHPGPLHYRPLPLVPARLRPSSRPASAPRPGPPHPLPGPPPLPLSAILMIPAPLLLPLSFLSLSPVSSMAASAGGTDPSMAASPRKTTGVLFSVITF